MSSSEEQRQRCDQFVSKSLQNNATIQFLLEKLETMGCKPPAGFIACQDCGDWTAGGGFGVLEEIISRNDNSHLSIKESSPLNKCSSSNQTNVLTENHHRKEQEAKEVTQVRIPEIFICQNHILSNTHVQETIIHELIHAIDMCRTNMDPLRNCLQLACTEIRAENLSGECNFWNEFYRGQMFSNTIFLGRGQACVKRRAILSVQTNPICRDNAEQYVDAAFARCYADTFPFDRHPNQK
jgi:hypothetical protein